MTKKIGLLWHSLTSDNLGVGALSVSHFFLIDCVAKSIGISPQYILIGTNGTMDYLNSVTSDSIEVLPISLREMACNFPSSANLFKDCAVVFDIGEGDSFSDIYGLKRFASQLISKILVLQKGIPLILSPQTIGPFKSAGTRFLAKQVMKRATQVFPRDGLSMQVLEEFQLFNSTEVIDIAFGLPFTNQEKFSTIDGKLHFGLNVSALLYNGGYSQDNQFKLVFDYVDFISKLISNFAKRKDVEIHLISHVISDTCEVEDDYRTALIIQKRFPFCRVAPKFDSPIAAKTYISGLDFFVGSRMHATIAAFSCGIPVIPVAYSRKFSGLFGSLGYEWVVDATFHSLDYSLGLISDGIARREELSALVKCGNATAKAKLAVYADFLAKLLRDVYAV
jgi:colanic acid/amylovoran biosynthesis protein